MEKVQVKFTAESCGKCHVSRRSKKIRQEGKHSYWDEFFECNILKKPVPFDEISEECPFNNNPVETPPLHEVLNDLKHFKRRTEQLERDNDKLMQGIRNRRKNG